MQTNASGISSRQIVSNRPTPDLTKKDKTSSDYEVFLKMLTTQIKNQDPMNPMESNDFAVQLATFSGVEQQVRTNDLLEDMASKSPSGGLVHLSSLVGRTIRSVAPAAYSGSSIEILTVPATSADQSYLVAIDSSGKEIIRSAIPSDGGILSWPSSSEEKFVPNGTYTFQVQSFHKGTPLKTTTAETFTKVVGVELLDGSEVLTLSGGITAYIDEIKAIY